MISKADNNKLLLQKELYKIAEKQHATNSILVDRDSRSEERIFFSRNDASRTASPTILFNRTDDSSGTDVKKSEKDTDLYNAAKTVIDKHNEPKNKDKYIHRREQLSNAVNHLEEKKAIKLHPELKPFYSAQETVNKEVADMPPRIQERFVSKTNSKILDAIAKRSITNEKINDRSIKSKKNERDIER